MIAPYQICVVADLRALSPGSGRSATGARACQAQPDAWTGASMRHRPRGVFPGHFEHGAGDGVTRLSRIQEKRETARNGTSYDGTAATKCTDLTSYNTTGRFRMSIRYKNGAFYDGTAAVNIEGTLREILCGRTWNGPQAAGGARF